MNTIPEKYAFTRAKIGEYTGTYSKKVSDINRSLALAGIAVAWLFLYQSGSNTYHLIWIVPIALFFISMAIDIYQYGYAYNLFNTAPKNFQPDEKGIYRIEKSKVNKIDFLFWPKVFFTGGGYGSIVLLFFIGLPTKSVKLTGTVFRENTETPIASTIRIFSLPQKEPVGTLITDTSANGSFRFKLPEKRQYLLSVEADGFFHFNEVIDADSIASSGKRYFYKTIYLKPIGYGIPQQLDEVYFEFNKANLLPASYESLNKLAKLLKKNPILNIKVDAHTDDIGTTESNRRLSEARAKAVQRHLINSGISSERIATEGFGEEKPIADNNTEWGRSMNRRVEFTILK